MGGNRLPAHQGKLLRLCDLDFFGFFRIILYLLIALDFWLV